MLIMDVTFKIKRFDPDSEVKIEDREYTVNVDKNASLLDALIQVREEQEVSQWQERGRRYPLTPAPNGEMREWRRGEIRRGFKLPEEQGKSEQEVQEIRKRRIFQKNR